MPLLFVYGTLRYYHYRKESMGRIPLGRRAAARNVRKTFITWRGEPYPILIPCRTAHQNGYLLDVNAQDLRALDQYEDPLYERTRINLTTGEIAHAYLARPRILRQFSLRCINGHVTVEHN